MTRITVDGNEVEGDFEIEGVELVGIYTVSMVGTMLVVMPAEPMSPSEQDINFYSDNDLPSGTGRFRIAQELGEPSDVDVVEDYEDGDELADDWPTLDDILDDDGDDDPTYLGSTTWKGWKVDLHTDDNDADEIPF